MIEHQWVSFKQISDHMQAGKKSLLPSQGLTPLSKLTRYPSGTHINVVGNGFTCGGWGRGSRRKSLSKVFFVFCNHIFRCFSGPTVYDYD